MNHFKKITRHLCFSLTLPLVVAGLSISGNIHAFSPENHQQLSIAAVTYFKNNCDSNQSFAWADAEHVGKGAKGEDNIFRLTRLFNWHFFNPRKNLKESKHFVNPTPDRYLAIAEKKIQKGIRKSNKRLISKAVGAYAHYIQDNANPAHISPIYHDPFQKDLFDGWELPIYSIFDEDFCEDVNTGYATLLEKSAGKPRLKLLRKIYEDVFHETNSIFDSALSAKANGDHITLKWKDFWDNCDGDDFCNYEDSLLGNNFGKREITVIPKKILEGSSCQTGAKCVIEIGFDQYHHFAQQQARLAALNTMLALHLVSDAYRMHKP